MVIFSLFLCVLQTKKLVLLPESYQFVFKKKDLPNTELRYINWRVGNVKSLDIYLNKNAMGYFFKAALLLFCL